LFFCLRSGFIGQGSYGGGLTSPVAEERRANMLPAQAEPFLA